MHASYAEQLQPSAASSPPIIRQRRRISGWRSWLSFFWRYGGLPPGLVVTLGALGAVVLARAG